MIYVPDTQLIWTCLNLTTQLYLNGFTYTNTVHNTEVRAERRTEEDSRDERGSEEIQGYEISLKSKTDYDFILYRVL